MIERLVRENIKRLKPYSSARNKVSEGVLLDANENPVEQKAFNGVTLNRYPDPNHRELKSVLGEYIGVSQDKLFMGNGSDEAIDLLYRIFCEPGKDNVVIPQPTYGMYSVSAEINNVEVRTTELNDKFLPDIESIVKNIDANTKLIFFCSPNNPTGNVIPTEIIDELYSVFDGIIVIDEAYIDFTNSYENNVNRKRVVKLRTFSKAWGLAAVRCGYAIADPEIIKYFYRVKPPYNLNGVTQKIVIDAILNKKYKDDSLSMILSERKKLQKELAGIKGIEPVSESEANFVLIKTDQANELYEYLFNKGIVIRNRSTQVNLKGCLRITVGLPNENDLLINEIRKFYE